MDVIDILLAEGWEAEEPDDGLALRKVYTRLLSADLVECSCNHKVPAITVSNFIVGEPSCTVELRAEANGKWVKLQSYGLRSIDEVRVGIKMMHDAWVAVSKINNYKEGDVVSITEKMYEKKRGGGRAIEKISVKLKMDPVPSSLPGMAGLYSWGERLNGSRKGQDILIRTDDLASHNKLKVTKCLICNRSGTERQTDGTYRCGRRECLTF
jgi:hypothetical protein